VREALDAYRRLQPAAGPFRGSMFLLLGLLTLLSLLFSSWMGFRLAKQITDPIQRLAHAADEVAAGNLEVRVEHRGGEDEIGLLVAGFNRMASDLEASRGDLERRRALMEVVLGGVGAGVISVDANGLVTTVNASAIRLLGIAPGSWIGAKLGEMLRGAPLDVVEHLLSRIHSEGRDLLRQQVAISVDGEHRILNWTVSALRAGDAAYTGAVALLDDVTQIVRGQRTAAWRDVARRIAHEVKNPLTPIQLSAQRLRRKLGPRIADAESRQVLEQCTDAITAQVEAMKVLVSEFSKFAALPATDPTPTDLNALVSEAIAMYKGKPSIEFTAQLADELPELDVDREQIKRVILNLVDNAMVAIEAAGPGPRAIGISTRIDRAVGTVQLEVADTGSGVRPEDRARLFQPGFSTKKDGTGIGLTIVSRIVSDHSGHIRVRSNQPRGTRFVIELPARL
jgi:two-component system nitrogen regulation sensor histidine kinase NtrY